MKKKQKLDLKPIERNTPIAIKMKKPGLSFYLHRNPLCINSKKKNT